MSQVDEAGQWRALHNNSWMKAKALASTDSIIRKLKGMRQRCGQCLDPARRMQPTVA